MKAPIDALAQLAKEVEYCQANVGSQLRLRDAMAEARYSLQQNGWQDGAPAEAGHYWIYRQTLQGERRVEAVNIGPAICGTGKLLLKLGSGVAYEYEANRTSITHHQFIEAPAPPVVGDAKGEK